ncbi:hypothetical protein MRB53_023426 [Persea americana]|uniref:Uncharacterized protein n=1 Tax=Persea americana TaxID=3435 RepID=A0ACC2LAL1_PERAE|nr:hypothetical protein MRB53_023426 [Persea americana]
MTLFKRREEEGARKESRKGRKICSGNTGLFWIVILDLGSYIRIPGPMVGLKDSYWDSGFSVSVVLFAYDG